MTLAITIIVILSLAVVFLLIKISKREKAHTYEKWIERTKQWTTADMIDFGQSVSNNEVTVYDFTQWCEREINEKTFSEN